MNNGSIVAKAEDQKQHHRDQIASTAREVMSAQTRVDNMVAKIQKEIEALPEYGDLDEALEQVGRLREQLSIVVNRNSAINEMKENLATYRVKLKVAKSELSSLLVHYTAEHKEKSLIVNHEHRMIDITAKLGKPIDKQEILPL